MHPGADVGVDLFISMLLAPTIVFAILGPANHWRSTGKHGLGTVAGRLELAAIVGLIIMLLVILRCEKMACMLTLEQSDPFCFFCMGLPKSRREETPQAKGELRSVFNNETEGGLGMAWVRY